MNRLVKFCALAALVSLAGCGREVEGGSAPSTVRPPADAYNRFGVRAPGPDGDYNLTDEEKRQAEEDLAAYRREMGLPPLPAMDR